MPVVGQASVRIVADARGFARDVERVVNSQLREVDTAPGARSMAQRTNTVLERETRRGFRDVARTGLQAFGTTLQGGVSPATAGAFGLVVLAALTPVMAVVGAAAGGALVLAFGGAIAGIGIIAAAQSDEVQEAFSRMVSEVTDVLQDLAEPFEDVLVTIASIARGVIGDFQEPLQQAFQDLAPEIERFARAFGRALSALTPTIQPLTDAFILLLRELGPALADEVFPDLADAIVNLSRAVSENADTITDIITWFLSAAEAVINFTAELTRLAGWFAEQGPAIQAIIIAVGTTIVTVFASLLGPVAAVVVALIGLGAFIATLQDEIGEFFSAIAEVAGQFVDQLKQIWDRLRNDIEILVNTVQEIWNRFMQAVRDVRTLVVNAIDSLVSGVQSRWNTLTSGVETVASNVRSAFNSVISFISGLPGRIASAASGMWDGIGDAFASVINGIIRAWNDLRFQTGQINTPLGQIGPFTLDTPNVDPIFLQEGGIVRQGGMAVVGEAGPELLSLQRGARVDPLPTGGESAPVDVRVFIGQQELTDIVDVQINERNTQLRRRTTSRGAGQTRTGVRAA